MVISLSVTDLFIAASLVVLLAGLSLWLRLGIERSLLIAALRTAVQLTLIGLVLKAVFNNVHMLWVTLIAVVMLLIAGREVMARQKRRFIGAWGFTMGTFSMFVSTFSVMLLALLVIVDVRPWYTPQYAIPLLGMMFGNTMNGIALALDRLTQQAWHGRNVIEARLMLGESAEMAMADIRRESMRTGMIPMINAMAAAGLVSLPGMMTGQILAGVAPMEAVKYQILIMFMVTAGCGLGALIAVQAGARRLFDERQRLRLERLR